MGRDIVDRSAPVDISRRAAIVTLAMGVAGCSDRAQTTTSENAQLTVSPEESLIDEPLSIHLTDLSLGEHATIWTSFIDAEGVEWRSYAQFEADESGEINPTDHSPLEGTYEGRDSGGLLWSRRPIDPEPAIVRPIFDDEFELQVVVTQNDDRITETTVTRRTAAPGLRRIEPEHNPGVLFEPSGDGPYPGLLLFHGSEGQPTIELAKLFASHGYAAFALQYFGPPREIPDRLHRVPLSLVEENAAWLRNQSRVSSSEIGLIGWSRGSEIALLAGTILDEIGVVIGVSPSELVFDGYLLESEPVHAWTYEGDELPHIPIDSSTGYLIDTASAAPRGAPIGSTPLFEAALGASTEQQIEAATIPVEEIDAPLFLFSGTDDATWPAVQLATYAEQQRNQHGLPVEHHIYEGAGHLIGSSPATVPTTQATTGSHFLGQGLTENFGGTPEANAAANAGTWSRILQAFEEELR